MPHAMATVFASKGFIAPSSNNRNNATSSNLAHHTCFGGNALRNKTAGPPDKVTLFLGVLHQGSMKTVATAASYGDSLPAHKKYKSRKELEKEYYREWEKATLLTDEELERPMTPVTFLRFLPSWFRFYAIPGPVRFIFHIISQRLAVVFHKYHKWMVLQGAKFDAMLLKRAGAENAFPPIGLIMYRYHGRIAPWDNIRYRIALFRGVDKYIGRVKDSDSTNNMEGTSVGTGVTSDD